MSARFTDNHVGDTHIVSLNVDKDEEWGLVLLFENNEGETTEFYTEDPEEAALFFEAVAQAKEQWQKALGSDE